jgi:GTP-binding protein
MPAGPRGTDLRLDDNRRATRAQRREQYFERMDAKAEARAELEAEREAGVWRDDAESGETVEDDE